MSSERGNPWPADGTNQLPPPEFSKADHPHGPLRRSILLVAIVGLAAVVLLIAAVVGAVARAPRPDETALNSQLRVEGIVVGVSIAQGAYRSITAKRYGDTGRYGTLAELYREGLLERGVETGSICGYRLHLWLDGSSSRWMLVAVPSRSEARWYIHGSMLATVHYRKVGNLDDERAQALGVQIRESVLNGRAEAEGWTPCR